MFHKMIEASKKLLYYVVRKGGIYGFSKGLAKRNKIYLNGNPFLTKRFYSYFSQLDPKQYRKELEEQISVFFSGSIGHAGIDCPKSFNEKIQWIKLHDLDEEKTRLADKIAVREWVEKRIGKEYLVPLVGGPWDSADQICVDTLPEQFVLKANHGCGMNRIVLSKEHENWPEARREAKAWLNTFFGWKGMEHQYFNIERKVYAEALIKQKDGDLLDYKVHCFNGEPRIIHVIGERDLENHTAKEAFFDTDWNRTDLMYNTYEQYDVPPQKPKVLPELLELCRKLSDGFRYVRVDMYILGDEIKFGEMTFTPAKGVGEWANEDNDILVGGWIDTSFDAD